MVWSHIKALFSSKRFLFGLKCGENGEYQRQISVDVKDN